MAHASLSAQICIVQSRATITSVNVATMSDPGLIEQLFTLLLKLHQETEGYLDRQDDPQLWYNRGYANGMIAALRVLGHAERLQQSLTPDPYDLARDQEHLPWGKAYEHGREMGWKETFEVLPS